jgi:hypothetical protein
MAYQLILTYTHCYQEKEVIHRRVETEIEAKGWLEDSEPLPVEDCVDETGKECPVAMCAMKLQQPRKSIRLVDATSWGGGPPAVS